VRRKDRHRGMTESEEIIMWRHREGSRLLGLEFHDGPMTDEEAAQRLGLSLEMIPMIREAALTENEGRG
jgi:hypothetical protein